MKDLPTSVLNSRLTLLSEEKCQVIYDAALTIIADIGMTVPHAEARDILVNGPVPPSRPTTSSRSPVTPWPRPATPSPR